MRTILKYRLLILFAMVALFSGCEKVIQVDLNKGEERLVVEGWITNQDTTKVIKLTKTSNYFSSAAAPAQRGAIVVVTDDSNQLDTFREGEPGIYLGTKLKGIAGHTYKLSIKTPEGKEYFAQSLMPKVKPMDSMAFRYHPKGGFQDAGYYVIAYAKEPQNEANWYRWQIWANDTLYTNEPQKWLIADDKFVAEKVDGIEVGNVKLLKGQRIKFQIQGITEETFNYYMALSTTLQNDGGMFSPPPANPHGNVSNGALGFFGAFSVAELRGTVK